MILTWGHQMDKIRTKDHPRMALINAASSGWVAMPIWVHIKGEMITSKWYEWRPNLIGKIRSARSENLKTEYYIPDDLLITKSPHSQAASSSHCGVRRTGNSKLIPSTMSTIKYVQRIRPWKELVQTEEEWEGLLLFLLLSAWWTCTPSWISVDYHYYTILIHIRKTQQSFFASVWLNHRNTVEIPLWKPILISFTVFGGTK